MSHLRNKTATHSVRLASIALIVLMMLTAAFADLGGTDGGFDLSWHSIDGGGGTSSGGAFALSGIIGQPDAGMMSGGAPGNEFELAGGFWSAAGPTPGPLCPPDIAPSGGDGMVNVSDLLAVINGWGACDAPCPPSCAADIAPAGGDCNVNVSDLLAVINGWGMCP